MYLSALLFLSFSLCVVAIPLGEIPKEIEKRDVVCSGDAGVPYDTGCYGQLGLTDWLNKWVQTTPRCGPNDNGTQCCGPHSAPNEPWSTCFLRVTTGNADNDCSQINLKSCSQGASPIPGITDMAQVRYVVRNLYAINSAFTNWYAALQFATGQAALAVPQIITMVDPPKATNVVLNDVLSVLMSGIAILAAPIGPFITADIAAASALSASIQQAPTVAKLIWPAGTVDSQLVQIGQLQSTLGTVNQDIENRINGALQLMMTDVGAFTAFASSGAFSGPAIPSLPAETAELAIGLKAYIFTVALSQNQWQATTGPGFTDGLTSSPDSQASNFGCTIESSGICDQPKGKGKLGQPQGWAEWTSQATKISYSPFYNTQQSKPPKQPSATDIMNAITNNGWGTLALVFDGSYNCTKNHKYGQGHPPVVLVNDQGQLDYSCIGQLYAGTGCGSDAEPWAKVQPRPKNCELFFNN